MFQVFLLVQFKGGNYSFILISLAVLNINSSRNFLDCRNKMFSSYYSKEY
jgi:hypothetical protein